MVHVNVFCLCIYKYIAQECTFHQYASGGVFATILASRINYVCVCVGGDCLLGGDVAGIL